MQIMSRDKLCAVCQPQTWAFGWLSVTCVRAPLHLRRTTLMTWCWVSLPCIHPVSPHALNHPTLLPLHPLLCHPPTHHQATWQRVTSRRAEGNQLGFTEDKDGQHYLSHSRLLWTRPFRYKNSWPVTLFDTFDIFVKFHAHLPYLYIYNSKQKRLCS